ncbi:guanine deaminase [Aplysia californica]|uniref:Guanine deaminase n=1 Tax=Aplysia californica TaxID=6500 RepID=A0ABM0JFS1_APLCA|nr:guanine deaminase [Aplysia californica]
MMSTMSNGSEGKDRDLVVVGTFIHALGLGQVEILEETALGVRAGKIVFIDKTKNLADRLKEFSITPDKCLHLEKHQFVIPGFVDSHAHAPQLPFMGTGSDLQLLPWLKKYTYPTEAKIASNHEYATEVYKKCVTRTLKSGSTTVCYYATIDVRSTLTLVDIVESVGQRAYIGKVNMDRNSPDNYIEQTKDSMENTRKFVQDVIARKNSLITPCVTPRFAISCTPELMAQLGDLAQEYSLPVQTHISENLDEVKAVTEMFPDCQSYTDVYDQAGLLGERTVLGHGVYLSPEELQMLKSRGSGISHCPNSNFCLCSGVLDVRRPLQAGVKVGLGTDFAGGNSPSMLDAIKRGMEAAVVTSLNASEKEDGGERLSYKDMFFLATLGSCQVMGLEGVVGNFTVGKDFDALVIDPKADDSPFDVFAEETIEERFQKYLFLGMWRKNVRSFFSCRH